MHAVNESAPSAARTHDARKRGGGESTVVPPTCASRTRALSCFPSPSPSPSPSLALVLPTPCLAPPVLSSPLPPETAPGSGRCAPAGVSSPRRTKRACGPGKPGPGLRDGQFCPRTSRTLAHRRSIPEKMDLGQLRPETALSRDGARARRPRPYLTLRTRRILRQRRLRQIATRCDGSRTIRGQHARCDAFKRRARPRANAGRVRRAFSRRLAPSRLPSPAASESGDPEKQCSKAAAPKRVGSVSREYTSAHARSNEEQTR